MDQPHRLSWLHRLFPVERSERKALFWASAYFFFILCGYYVLRPVRDSLGASVKGLQNNLPVFFTINLIAFTVINVLYGVLTSKFQRKQFIPYVYHFFAAVFVIFFTVLHVCQSFPEPDPIFLMLGVKSNAPQMLTRYAQYGLFLWGSIFNLCLISIFWDLMSDIFHSEQSKRLFSLIVCLGNVGAIVGSAFTQQLSTRMESHWFLVPTFITIELAVACFYRLNRCTTSTPEQAYLATQPPGKKILSGMAKTFSSPYLLAIAVFMVLVTFASTFFYMKQSALVKDAFVHLNATLAKQLRTEYFARVDLYTNILNFFLPMLASAFLIKRLGVGITLAIGVVITAISFFIAGSQLPSPLVWFLVIQVVMRSLELTTVKPARKVLFTVLSRDEKYSAQTFVDTFFYRLGDLGGSWSYWLLQQRSVSMGFVAAAATPIWIGWTILSLWLGHKHKQRAETLAKQNEIERMASP